MSYNGRERERERERERDGLGPEGEIGGKADLETCISSLSEIRQYQFQE